MTPQEIRAAVDRSVAAALDPYLTRSSTTRLVAPHAEAIHKIADDMEAAGIGCHATRGHVVQLRRMADTMIAEAVMNRVPDIYNLPGGGSNFASAERVDANANMNSVAGARLVVAQAEVTKKIRAMGIEPGADGRVTAKQISEALRAKGISTGQILARTAELFRAGAIRAPADDDMLPVDEHGRIQVAALDEKMKGMSSAQRWQIKKDLHFRGLL